MTDTKFIVVKNVVEHEFREIKKICMTNILYIRYI